MSKTHLTRLEQLAFIPILLGALLFAQSIFSATLSEVTEFGPNPSQLEMHLYVPDSITANPPVLLAVHYCTGSGPMFFEGTDIGRLADEHGFIAIFPSATREGNCFDVASPAALKRNGGSDPVAIKSMLDYVLSAYDADADEVYVLGVSSGAMMTNVLLALYPEVFRAGVAFAGVPYTCFATSDESLWNNKCSSGAISKTANDWGDLVRAAYPGFNGPYPRFQLWHGTEDKGLDYVNFNEEIKQWTNVHGLDQKPDSSDQPQPGYTRTRYGSRDGLVLVEAISLQGVPHNLPIDTGDAIRFLGLDQPTISSPQSDLVDAVLLSTWRPFSDASPWNTPVPVKAKIDPRSNELIADFASRGGLSINMEDWSIPVYYVNSENTPLHDVGDLRPGVFGHGFSPPRAIPIPEGATASLPIGGDEHMAIIDIERGLEWGMWHTRKVNGRWMTGLGAVTDLNGTGIAPAWNTVEREFDAHRARASGFPLVAGLIRVEEVLSGHIPHALVFAYDFVQTEHFIPPASTAQASTGGTRNNRDGMPMGAHIQLDPSFDVQGSGLSPAGKTIARALQEYGAYLGDFAGANVLYAESAPSALRAWEGVLGSDDLKTVFTSETIARQFRLLDMGKVERGQNFNGNDQ